MMHLIAAFVRRDFLQEVSYRLSFAWQLLTLVFPLAVLWFLARMMETPPAMVATYGSGYFAFSLVGFAVAEMTWAAASSFAQRVRYDQVVGTLEAMMVASGDWNRMVLASGVYSLGFSLLRCAVLLIAASLFGGTFTLPALATCLPVLALVLVSYGALGVVSAAFTLVLKRGDPVAAFFGLTTFLLSGTLYPVAALPEGIRWTAQLLPGTHGIEACRRIAISGQDLASVSVELAVLAGFAIVLSVVAWLSLRWAVAYVRRNGLRVY